jgi:hypothetical protein
LQAHFHFSPAIPAQKNVKEPAIYQPQAQHQTNMQTKTPTLAADNRRLAKVAVQYSADTFVVNQSLVLRIKICGKNRHLRQAPSR